MRVCWQCERVIHTSDSNKRWMRARCRRGCVDGDIGPGDVVPGDVVRVFCAGVSSKRLICSVFG